MLKRVEKGRRNESKKEIEEKVKEGRRREFANRIKKRMEKIGEVEKKKTKVKEGFEWREGEGQKEITGNGCYAE